MASRSPTAVTPLPKPTSAPETPLKETTTTTAPQAVPFPPPQTFDIIPPLHGLLIRLLSPQTNTEDSSGSARAGGDTTGVTGPGPSSSAPTQSQSQQQQQSSGGNGNNGSSHAVPSSSAPGPTSVTAEIAALGSNAPPPLDIKDLPTEASSIKIRIQKAHNVVSNLPDVERSVAEQETEIEELEDRIARLQSVISDFGKRAGAEGSKRTIMDQP
ncbi:hypothetical protein ASPWEDRAFT_168932 [Aspergillus wentii DTO 134E9]|uniref:Mediator of RNA polymerase II transcription subunit 9 n=1 Tax=Aspergillus wentii DTO 134E9 TaxID=1073089 RepID=A0A1L9RW46_ASPWE|nr:uncharacterized protein ASPWEDRAFT_168932 [Aspergillus wentii DTO 134E9]KAI9929228.1 hypothetical protein MW887_001636 [Aspergillus wentii]OJJ39068.1 hypothetical protein ASPWEDRAFT_168932 [Aspergillus wentii DTO 134E9]